MNREVEGLKQAVQMAVLFHKTEGIGGLHRLMQPNVAKGLLDHFNGGQGVVLHLQQRDVELFGTTDQLRQWLTRACEDQALGGRLQGRQLDIGAISTCDAMLRRRRKNSMAITSWLVSTSPPAPPVRAADHPRIGRLTSSPTVTLRSGDRGITEHREPEISAGTT